MPTNHHASTVWNGATLTLVHEEEVFDPTYGFSWRQEWVGTKAQIDTKHATAINAGWRSTRRGEGDQHFLTINSPDPAVTGGGSPTETPTDVYELTTEYASQEIWNNPKLMRYAWGDTEAKTLQVISRFKHFCESRVRDLYTGWVDFADEKEARTEGVVAAGLGPTPIQSLGLDNPAAALDFAFGDANGAQRVVNLQTIYWQVIMGLDTWEPRRVVLSRRRTCSANYAAQHVVDGVEQIYTTAKLKELFAIPNAAGEIGQRLPNDPTEKPPNTAWAWKIRRQDSQQLRGTARVEEVIDWQFAAWSLLIYDLIS